MSGVEILLARIAVSAFVLLCTVPLACGNRIQRPAPAAFDRMVIAAFLCSRLAIFVLVFVVLRLPLRGDLPGFYTPQAQAILSGLLPYRDFHSSYGPLHGYLDACLLKIWNSGLAIMLFTILVEAILLPLWLTLGRGFIEERNLRIACALYLTSPFSVQFVSIDGQNTVIIGVLLTLALLLVQRDRIFFAGGSIGASIVLIKFLSALYIPAFFLMSPRRWRWMAGCIATILAGYSFVLLAHAPVLQPILSEGQFKTSGNLPYLFESMLNVTVSGKIWHAILLCALAAILVQMMRVASRSGKPANIHVLTFGMVALTLTLLIFSMKAQPAYLMTVLFPVYLLFARPNYLSMVGLSCFSLAALVEPTIWIAFLGYPNSSSMHAAIHLHQTASILFMAMQFPVLGGYCWLLCKALVRMGRPSVRQQVGGSQRLSSELVPTICGGDLR